MEKFDSITHFLETGGFNYRVFDMGRKVTRLSNQLFSHIENQQELYPFPFQKKSWLALVFWQEGEKKKAVIWFLQFPLDELGFLKQESRDHFLIDLLEQAAKNIQAKNKGEHNLDELSESPFAFKPRPERLAMFHALVNTELNQDPSRYYQATREYLKGNLGFDQWQFLGLQGIADVVARLDFDENNTLLKNAINEMPEEPLLNFSYALENIHPKGLLSQVLIGRLQKEIASENNNVQLIAALMRALSGSEPEKEKLKIIKILLSSFGSEIEVLAAISGRAWESLYTEELLMLFVQRLSEQDQPAFNAILTDLMMLPKMRDKLMDIIRNRERGSQLSGKLDEFMSLLKT